MNNVLKKSLIILGISLAALLVFYCGVAYYYKGKFMYGTFINNEYCTGKSVADINTLLLKDIGNYEGLEVIDKDGNDYLLSAEDVNLTYDFTNKLIEYINKQNLLFWGINIFNAKNINMLPDITLDQEAFDRALYDLPVFTHVPEDNRVIRINKTLNNGYELINMRENVLNEEYAASLIVDAFNNFEKSIDLKEKECYRNLAKTKEMQDEIDLYNKIDAFQDKDIVFVFGDDKETVNKTVACTFMATDSSGNILFNEDGSIKLDESKLYDYVDTLAEKYNTYGHRYFKTTQGRTVLVEGGNYGNQFNVDKEKEYLLNAFTNNVREEHVPEYEYEAPIKGANDLGDTYIEIDLTNQKMYYYENGEQVVGTDIVSGNLAAGHSTIRGTYSIYNHRKDTFLIGPDYRSFVRYWLGIFKGYGIHDASWRNKFGGEIYKTAGSHGCVNTPYENIKTMWERVEDGTPCIVFY